MYSNIAIGAVAVLMAASFLPHTGSASGHSSFDPKKPYTLYGKEGRSVVISPDGLGSTPNNEDAFYFGFIAWMKPKDFLSVNPERPNAPSEASKSAWLSHGIGAPILYVDIEPEESIDLLFDLERKFGVSEDQISDKIKKIRSMIPLSFVVRAHEGRGRTHWIEEYLGSDVEIPVTVHFRQQVRSRHFKGIEDVIGNSFIKDRYKIFRVPINRFIFQGVEMSRRGSMAMAPGYRSWKWTQQDWRSVVPRGKSLDWSTKCGSGGTRTKDGRPALCLPLPVIERLLKMPGGEDILKAQAMKKWSAKKGQRVPWHPTIKMLHRQLEMEMPEDNPRLRSRR